MNVIDPIPLPDQPQADAVPPAPDGLPRYRRFHGVRAKWDAWKVALRERWQRRQERRDRLAALLREFEEDYARFYAPGQTKPPEVGRPYLLRPWRIRGGVVLAHGYMAAPLEVRALAEHLRRRGFAVYAVRMRGHGTTPEDLSERTWQDWYASMEQAVALMETVTDRIAVAGFSTGGCLALLAASRMPERIQAVVSICAPLYVRKQSIHFAPSIVGVNSLLKRFGVHRFQWDYVPNHPENQHINYNRNPLTGVRQLRDIMAETDRRLAQITAPALVVQSSKDTIVHPDSGPDIFERLGAARKELTVFERNRHGIINGEDSDVVHARIAEFLMQVLPKQAARRKPADVAAVPAPAIPASEVPEAVEAPLLPEASDVRIPISG